jgi:peptidyl-dipeptidase A
MVRLYHSRVVFAGQSWQKLLKSTVPFPAKANPDLGEALVKQGYTAEKIFLLADDFFSSLGLPRLPFSFWRDSVLEKPNDGRELECHPTA